jgi:hypothetical protein
MYSCAPHENDSADEKAASDATEDDPQVLSSRRYLLLNLLPRPRYL